MNEITPRRVLQEWNRMLDVICWFVFVAEINLHNTLKYRHYSQLYPQLNMQLTQYHFRMVLVFEMY